MAPSVTTVATSIYDPKHRKALEDFTQRLLTQVHHAYDIPYEYLLRDIYDTMVWSAPTPPTKTKTNAKAKIQAEKQASKKDNTKDIKEDIKEDTKKEATTNLKKKKKLRHLELLVVDDGEPFWVDTKTGLLYTYKDKIAIASLHPTLGSSCPADLTSEPCSSSKSKIWM